MKNKTLINKFETISNYFQASVWITLAIYLQLHSLDGEIITLITLIATVLFFTTALINIDMGLKRSLSNNNKQLQAEKE